MNKGYREREKYKDRKDQVTVPVKDDGQKKRESEKIADRIPTVQGSNR